MNDMMTRDTSMTIFVTFFAGVLDLDSGRLCYCNTGHKEPVMIPQFSLLKTKQRNLPVGAMSDWAFTQQETTLASGTTLFLDTEQSDDLTMLALHYAGHSHSVFFVKN